MVRMPRAAVAVLAVGMPAAPAATRAAIGRGPLGGAGTTQEDHHG